METIGPDFGIHSSAIEINRYAQDYKPENIQEGDLSFADFLDIINPLQHIPVVATIYRELTGDTITPMARVMGGALFGGPIGAIASTASVGLESATGKDTGQTLLALVGVESSVQSTMLAKAPAAAPATLAEAAQASGEAASTPFAAEIAALPQGPSAAPLPLATPASLPASFPAAAPQMAVDPSAKAAGRLAPEQMAMPADATGLTTKSGLPGAGSIGPPGAAMAVSQATVPPPGTPAAALQQASTRSPAAETQAAPLQLAAAPGGFNPPRLITTQPRAPQATQRAELDYSQALTRPEMRKPTAAPTGGATPAAVQAPVEAAAVPGAKPEVSDAMMRALDKYDALVRSRRSGSVDQTS